MTEPVVNAPRADAAPSGAAFRNGNETQRAGRDGYVLNADSPVNADSPSSTRVRCTEPIPHVRLFTEEIVIHRTHGLATKFESQRVALLALSFDYGGLRVPAARDEASTWSDDDDIFSDPHADLRMLRVEREARRLLEGYGAMDLSCADTYAVPTGVHADYIVRAEGTVHDFVSFAAEVVPQLRKQGFKVEVARNHEFQTLAVPPAYYADVEEDEEKPDWFNLELGIEVDGKRHSILPALLELLERSADGEALSALAMGSSGRGGRGVALPIKEHVYLHLPRERLQSILRVVAELYEGKGATPGVLGFPGVKAEALGRLDDLFQGPGHSAEGSDDPEGDTTSRGIRWNNQSRLAIRPEELLPAVPPAGLKATLRPYQVEGLTWLQRMRSRGTGGVLADDMGLGKTLQTIAHITLEKDAGRLLTPALIVAPTSLVNTWQRELAKFSPSLKVRAHHGPDRHKLAAGLFESDVVITSYPCACRDEDFFGTQVFHLLILDEAQTIKNEKSQAHRVMRGLSATHRLCLTGTPVENHLGELWALSDFLNPGLLGDELHFARFFRVPIEKQKNSERLMALRELLSPYIIRRTKAEVAKELPPKTELMRPIEAGMGQRELYESIRVAAHAEVRKIIKKKGLAAATIPILGALTKLRQVCCDPRLAGLAVDKKSDGTAVKSAKLDFFSDLLVDKLGSGQRVLVFSQFTSMLKLIAERLDELTIRYTALTGATMDRPKAVDRFQNREVDVFLISLRAGGTGLTLTTADTVIHYDPWWNPAIQAQATDRAYRIGQTKPVFVHHLYIAGSVEERMLRLQARKRKVADAILGAGEAQGALTEEDVDVLFAPLSA